MHRQSLAAQKLAAAASVAAIAAALGVHERTVANWRSGAKVPNENSARALQQHYEIDPLDWHRFEPRDGAPTPPAAAAPPAEGRHVAQGEPQEEPSAAPRGTMLDQIDRLRAELERAQRELQADATMPLANRSRLLSQMSSTTARLSKAHAVTREAIAESEAWRALLETIGEALKPFGAEPMRAVSEALAAEGVKAQAAGR